MDAIAKAKFMRITPRKARLVVDLIRGKRVDQAFAILDFTPRAASKILTNLLKSAVANATQKEGVDVNNLKVKTICVDQGPSLKRFMPRAMGKASQIKKRTSHITVVLEES
ncbi:MAG: 50S ribosomal protein L22 [Deltaproteobacteria bacterium]|jgi:large subunit ribosomal protein L22|nr:50S ribosomal protein L22 [Deltaproteobacteria bacterium]